MLAGFLNLYKKNEDKNLTESDQIEPRDSLTGLYSEEYFNDLLAIEKKRRQRSENPALLMLADLADFTHVSERQKIAKSMMDVLSEVTRDTDVKGWHVNGRVIGIMFTEMATKEANPSLILRQVATKYLGRLGSYLGVATFSRIQISWQSLRSRHIFGINKKLVLTEQIDSFRNDFKTEPSNPDSARLIVARPVYNKVQAMTDFRK